MAGTAKAFEAELEQKNKQLEDATQKKRID